MRHGELRRRALGTAGRLFGEVVAVERDVQHAPADLRVAVAGKQFGEADGQHLPAGADADDVDRPVRREGGDDLLGQLPGQPAHVGLVVVVPHRRRNVVDRPAEGKYEWAMLESIDHVNLVVSDLERMAEFYGSLLGLKPTKRVTISGPWIDRTVGLTGVHAEVIYLDPPAGPRVELLRYHSPAGDRPDGMGLANTHGLRHLAFRVRDIDAAVARLRRRGWSS